MPRGSASREKAVKPARSANNTLTAGNASAIVPAPSLSCSAIGAGRIARSSRSDFSRSWPRSTNDFSSAANAAFRSTRRWKASE